jgi:hypothetical protein
VIRPVRGVRGVLAFLGVLASGFFILAVPEPEAAPPDPDTPVPASAGEFAWNADTLWRALEARYAAARAAGCDGTVALGARRIAALGEASDALAARGVGPDDSGLDSLEAGFFGLAPQAAACPALLADYLALSGRMRAAIKRLSRGWDLSERPARVRLYRALYGGRAAVEEAMLQHPDRMVPLLAGTDEPSATPAAVVRGVTIHSGDMLVSRGGYPTSALIARGSDYPGNFSHVGLVHVDPATHAVTVIEAHIERGVALATAEEYLADKKLRLMVLRPRADLPALRADPMLPHRAAARMLARVRAGHIPYDFTMDYRDSSRVFCSEVASWVYRERGVNLWMGISTITRPGVRRWLASFGVRHFETQEPSDLEYDPQLVVVAEWRDAASLRQDHVDNAVVDAMLERADSGDALGFAWYRLPVARLAKAYSLVLGRLGRIGPVPEGMSAAAALRNQAFTDRERRVAAEVSEAAARRTGSLGYPPPYWKLVALARAAIALPASSRSGM